MTVNSSSKGLTAHGRKDAENEIRELVNHVLNQAKITTMDKKLIVEAATPGHYPAQLWEHFGIKDMPQFSIEGQADEIIKCAKAGAAAIHCHVRDHQAPYNYEVHADECMSAELIMKLLDKVYKEVDMVPLGHAWHPRDWQSQGDADYITSTKEILDAGKGNKYMQGGVVITWIYPHKDEFIKRPSESVKKVVEIARALGRDIATAVEAREILGIKVTHQK